MFKFLIGVFSGLCSGLVFANTIPITYYETLTNKDGQTQHTQYTAYFVLDYFDDEAGVLCRTFITFGDERLPQTEKKDYKRNAKKLFKDTEHVYAVAETYFYNWSKTIVLIQPLSFRWKGVIDESPFVIKDYTMTVNPESQTITPPIIKQAFYLKNEFDIEFLLTINGRERLIKGIAKRMTVDDLQLMNSSRKPG